MASTPGRGSSREKLLDAAADLIAKNSVNELTLEGVAAAAGVARADITVLTAVGVLWWLHDGDLVEAVTPAVIARDPE